MADYIFYVKVANSKFVLDSVSQATIALGHDITYRFDQSDSSNSGHPLVFSTTSDGTHNSGSAYTTGVTTTGTAGSSGAYVDIAVTSSTPASLYYYSAGNSGYGSAVITTGNTHVTTNNLGLLLPILADATDQWGSHINQSLRKIEDTFGANADVYTYNITGDTTAITGSATAGGTLAINDGQHIEVYLNGVKLVGNLSSGNDYTLNASTDTITLASNAVNGDVVNVVVFKTFQFADAVPATGGTFSGNVAYTGNIQVDDIVEKTSAHGVEIDGVTLKDGSGTFTGTGGNTGITIEDDHATEGYVYSLYKGRKSSADQNYILGYNYNSDTFAIVKGTGVTGTDGLHIDSSGNVAIGASSITRAYSGYNQVNINGSNGATLQFQKSGTTYGNIVNDSNAMYLQNSTAMAFGVGGTGTGTERLRIDSSGNVELKTTNADLILPSGGGISFQNHSVSSATGASSTTSANVLDDYEEGTWTPTLLAFSQTGTSTTSGKYTKIGRMVYFSLTVSTTGTITSTVNSSRFGGLPFQVISSGSAFQSGVNNFGDSHKGLCLIYTDESIYTEGFSAQDDTILISGFYETS